MLGNGISGRARDPYAMFLGKRPSMLRTVDAISALLILTRQASLLPPAPHLLFFFLLGSQHRP